MLVLLAVAPATAEQTYTLKLRMAVGERWAFDQTSTMKQKGQVMVNGQPAQAIDQSPTQVRKGTLEVLAVADGTPTAIKIAFDPSSANSGTMDGQPAPPFALAGKTVTLRRDATGGITNDLPEQPDPQTLAELNRMIQPDAGIYPPHPVAVDDEWDADPAALAKQFQLGDDDKVSMKCKLAAVSDVDGRRVADVALDGQVVKHDQGFIETTTTLHGTSRVDLSTGQVLATDMTGKMASRGNRTVKGQDGQMAIAVNVDGTLEAHQHFRPLDGAAAEQNGPAAAVAQNTATLTSRPADIGAHNPAASRPAASFSGSYKGDELSIVLAPAEGDRYTGTMTLRDRKFPVIAHAEGDRLLGTFQSEGSSFDFMATLEGDVLKLTSGGKDYTMRRGAAAPAAVENPLGKAGPKNPLAQ